MTNAELIAKIKAEIDKRYTEYSEKKKTDDLIYYEGMADALDLFEQFIDTLESKKPMNLEGEINRYLREECSDDDEPSIHEIAEHFAQWGAEHSGSSEIPKDLEEASIQAAQSDMQDRQIMEASNDERMRYSRIFRRGFGAGAKWDMERMKETYCPRAEKWKEVEETARHEYENGWKDSKEQMLKEAVEGEFFLNPYPTISLDDCKDYDFKDGDKVRIIIVKED